MTSMSQAPSILRVGTWFETKMTPVQTCCCLVLLLVSPLEAFLPPMQNWREISLSPVPMGLYDDPLPPRPSRKQPDPEEPLENDIFYDNSVRLFSFTENGREVNDLLPPLGRSLKTGVDCYYEPQDRIVRNLVDKTSVHVQDACWALEACKGDITEAWTCISTARRMKLITDRSLNSENLERMEFDMEQEFQERKEKRRKEQQTRDRDEFFRGGTPDQQWLPKENPRPVEDEPWFTG